MRVQRKRINMKRKKDPVKKYSTVFVDFAAPLLEIATNLDEFRQAVGMAKLVWNVGALDLAGDTPAEVALTRLRGEPGIEEATSVFEMLIDRRLSEFGEYEWVVDEATVRYENDDWIVRVEVKELQA